MLAKTKRYTVGMVLLAIVLAASILFIKSNRYLNNKAAVRAGTNWLVMQKEEMGPASAVTFFKLLYKIADPNTAERLIGIIKEEQRRIPVERISIDKQSYDWKDITPLAQKLFNEQCSGIDNSNEIAKLNRVFLSNKEDIKSEIPTQPGRVVSTLYFLGRLGISDNTLSVVTGKLENETSHSREDLYGLTHIIFTKSNYLDRYLDPTEFQREIKIFKESIIDILSTDTISTMEIDVLSEMITSLKILGIKDDKEIILGEKKLIETQDLDGSWGQDGDDKVHATVWAIMAISDFPEQPRKSDPYCLSD